MKRIYVPTQSVDDWKKHLAAPDKHWRSGCSAKELAECWERANGFPPGFNALFAGSDHEGLKKMELLLAIPEYQVGLPGRGHSSQNDLFVLTRTKDGELAVMMVEGKVSETFGEILLDWLVDASDGKEKRLQNLLEILTLPSKVPSCIRYQLLHRAASAMIEAKRFNARYAMMIIHSFSPEHRWLEDYQAFLGLYEKNGKENDLVRLFSRDGIDFFAGWVADQKQA
ncbi:MAG TPA: hypothetical protein PKW33_15885 [Anaerolineaceae bacterium]|nr:hypothetical protein [Anaerolineaceae bacterium]HPN53077.1 hypothetical protein [Anaerolineaceae bacterium]